MAFDDKTRSRLYEFVAVARNVLVDEFTRQLQNEYGLDCIFRAIADMIPR